MSLMDRLKEHWLISILLVCFGVSGATWKIAQEILVAPRDFQIAQLKEELQRISSAQSLGASSPQGAEEAVVLPETGVQEGNSITTVDGRCTLRVGSVVGSLVSLFVAVGSDKPIEFPNCQIGDRITVDGGDRIY